MSTRPKIVALACALAVAGCSGTPVSPPQEGPPGSSLAMTPTTIAPTTIAVITASSTSSTTTTEAAEVPPLLSVPIVDLSGSYDPATGRLGALDCTYKFANDPNDRWCFSAFATSSRDPSYDYKVAAGSQVFAAAPGVVVRVDAETNSRLPGEYEVWTRSEPNSTYTVIYDHVKNLTVIEGDRVEAGTVLGTTGVHASDPTVWGRVELQISRTINPNPVQTISLCPADFGTDEFNAAHEAALAAHNQANPDYAASAVCLAAQWP